MNRKAILLAASPEGDPVPGVYADLVAFDAFLRSNPGGAWDAKDIFQGKNSTRDEVLCAIQAAKAADYSLVYFAGHGEIVKMGLPWAEARMLLGSRETISERDLNSGSPRCTLILDCCQRASEEDEKALLIQPSTLLEHGEGCSEFRDLYQKTLVTAESGIVKVCTVACGSALADTHSFTQHLLNESSAWVTRHKGPLFLGEAVALAADAMKRENPQQQPEYQGGRRLRHFPFAVQI
jgi:hypothetical protein